MLGRLRNTMVKIKENKETEGAGASTSRDEVSRMREQYKGNLMIATMVYSNPENRRKQRIIGTVAGPIADYHSAANKKCRNIEGVREWTKLELKGGWNEPIRTMMGLLSNTDKLSYCGMRCELPGGVVSEEDKQHISMEEDDMALILLRLLRATVNSFAVHYLPKVRGWPNRIGLVADSEKAGKSCIALFRKDYANFEKVKTLRGTTAKDFCRR